MGQRVGQLSLLHEAAGYEQCIQSSFAKQGLMRTLGATLVSIAPGSVEIALIADSVAGYAALSLMPPGRGVLTTDFKINLVAPAVGECIIPRGKAVKSGRTLTLTQAEVFADSDGRERLIALLPQP